MPNLLVLFYFLVLCFVFGFWLCSEHYASCLIQTMSCSLYLGVPQSLPGANISAGKYIYMADLAIDVCRCPTPLPELPRCTYEITSPLNPAAWSVVLRLHPDQTFASYLLAGLHSSFRIGFDYASSSCLPCWSNMKSARDNPVVVSYLREELQLGHSFIPHLCSIKSHPAQPIWCDPEAWPARQVASHH